MKNLKDLVNYIESKDDLEVSIELEKSLEIQLNIVNHSKSFKVSSYLENGHYFEKADSIEGLLFPDMFWELTSVDLKIITISNLDSSIKKQIWDDKDLKVAPNLSDKDRDTAFCVLATFDTYENIKEIYHPNLDQDPIMPESLFWETIDDGLTESLEQNERFLRLFPEDLRNEIEKDKGTKSTFFYKIIVWNDKSGKKDILNKVVGFHNGKEFSLYD